MACGARSRSGDGVGREQSYPRALSFYAASERAGASRVAASMLAGLV